LPEHSLKVQLVEPVDKGRGRHVGQRVGLAAQPRRFAQPTLSRSSAAICRLGRFHLF